MFFFTKLVLLYSLINTVITLECFWNNKNKYDYFSSKTPYENVRGDIRDVIVKRKGCEPISVWTMIRHGKRNPGPKFLAEIKIVMGFRDSIISSYRNGNSSMCAQDVENLEKWKVDPSFEITSVLTREGYQATAGLGYRMKEALPDLLSDLKEGEYVIQPAFTPRTLSSAEAFVDALGNKNLFIEQVGLIASVADPYRECQKSVKAVFQNRNISNTILDYMKTKDYLDMTERIERKLGLNFTLTYKNIIAFYDLCRYTWEGITYKPSPWCAMFSTEDLKVLEYIADLGHYDRKTLGLSQFGTDGSQIPFADMLRKFEKSKKGTGKKIAAYFTHSSVMDMMLEALDLFKDPSPPTTHRELNRKWRTTFTSAFGVNMIAVLYRCKHSYRDEDDHHIAFYWNEKPLLELCNVGLCSWKEFENKFKPFSNASLDFCLKSD